MRGEGLPESDWRPRSPTLLRYLWSRRPDMIFVGVVCFLVIGFMTHSMDSARAYVIGGLVCAAVVVPFYSFGVFRWWLRGQPSPFEFGWVDSYVPGEQLFSGSIKQSEVDRLKALGRIREGSDGKLVWTRRARTWLRIVEVLRGEEDLIRADGWVRAGGGLYGDGEYWAAGPRTRFHDQ